MVLRAEGAGRATRIPVADWVRAGLPGLRYDALLDPSCGAEMGVLENAEETARASPLL